MGNSPECFLAVASWYLENSMERFYVWVGPVVKLLPTCENKLGFIGQDLNRKLHSSRLFCNWEKIDLDSDNGISIVRKFREMELKLTFLR